MTKVEAVNLSAVRGMPAKIDGIAILGESTVAVTNDKNFDIGRFDPNGSNVGKGLTRIIHQSLSSGRGLFVILRNEGSPGW
jgi:hypothetical protein